VRLSPARLEPEGVAMLVTRPQPDNDGTAAALRARGIDVLQAPMLRFEAVALKGDADADYGAVVVTSANVFRALEGDATLGRLLKLPLFAVGERTAQAARDAGFTKVIVAGGDASALRDEIVAAFKARKLKKSQTLLYLAGADLARDLASELSGLGIDVLTQTIYRMAAVPGLPHDVCEAFATNRIQAVLHYSRRSARAFVDAARDAGVEISALSIPQCCLSDSVAAVVREAGATQVMVAQKPDESALFDILDRALSPQPR
jgi:uroporphyrinogen-III synthase